MYHLTPHHLRTLAQVDPDIAQAMHNVAILRQNKGDWDGAK